MNQGITATDALRQVIEHWPAREHDEVLRMVEARTVYFNSVYNECGPAEFVIAFFEAFDEAIEAAKKRDAGPPISCKKGCYLCCRQNVTIWEPEAKVIADYCKREGIAIPREYLKAQLKYGWKEVASKQEGWCVFLKNGECSIHPARPLSCRKYFVASPPQFCDTVKYPSSEGHRVAVSVFTIPEIEASAFCGVLQRKCKNGRMAEMLLPYAT